MGADKRIDLNADVGESYGVWPMGNDREIMPYVTSANVACGGHAGDPNVMAATVKLAKMHGVAVGAHPGYPDMPGFGRRVLPFQPEEIKRFVLYQLGALWAIARAEGVELSHVKPHGALYNLTARDETTAQAVAEAVRSFSHWLPVVCLAGSTAYDVARNLSQPAYQEGFADRRYEPNGQLRSRNSVDAVLHDAAEVKRQVVQLANGYVVASDGSRLERHVDTICLHSDTASASVFAGVAREALEAAGFRLMPPVSQREV